MLGCTLQYSELVTVHVMTNEVNINKTLINTSLPQIDNIRSIVTKVLN